MDKERLSLYVPTAVSKRLRGLAKEEQRSLSQMASIVLTKAILDEPEEPEEIFPRVPAKVKPKANTEDSFNAFWGAYPRKTNKKGAHKAWNKLNPPMELISRILNDIAMRKTHQWSDKQFIPHPATYLNNERWEDEVITNENSSRGTTDNSAVAKVERAIAEQRAGQEPNPVYMAQDGQDLRQQVHGDLRGNASNGMDECIEGHYTTHD